ncbi:MAG TPA: DinB family protein, partial [Mycobacterium sp.]
MTPGELTARFLKGRLRMDRINGLGVDDLAQRSAEQLVAVLRDNAEPHGFGAGFGGRVALTDNMIHQQDIRRPLGITRTIPVERLFAALDFVRFSPTIRGAWLARGLRLVATDFDWSHGKGPEVRGCGEALLMAMAGRPDALRDLDGPGTARLAARMKAG